MCDIFGQSGGISFFIAKEGIPSICITSKTQKGHEKSRLNSPSKAMNLMNVMYYTSVFDCVLIFTTVKIFL